MTSAKFAMQENISNAGKFFLNWYLENAHLYADFVVYLLYNFLTELLSRCKTGSKIIYSYTLKTWVFDAQNSKSIIKVYFWRMKNKKFIFQVYLFKA